MSVQQESLEPEALVLRYLENPRPDLKDMIMVRYASLVERVARRFNGLEAQEDLVQVGFIGLLNALSKYDPAAGVKFNTYASHLVAGEIKHFLRDRSQVIRIPAWLQELRHKVTRATRTLTAEYGRVPTDEEVARAVGVSESAVQEVHNASELLKVGSLDASLGGDDEGDAEIDKLESGAFSPEQLSVEDRVVLESAIKQLRDLERDVLVMFHFDALNQTEIAHRLGISCNYVSHILRQSLAKLKRILTTEEDKERLLKRQAAQLDDGVLDGLTGVYTEAYFQGRLSEEIHRASSENGAMSVVFLEFDGIEALRGYYGEASVRDFLADVADFLRENVRRLDIVCRFGPLGFGIILPSTGASVGIVTERLLNKLEPWLTARRAPTGPIRPVVGQATYPESGRSAEDLTLAGRPITVRTQVRSGARAA